MTTTSTTSSTSPGGDAPAVRKAYRSADDRYLGGVAGGLAEHLGVDSLYVRLFFLASALLGGFGVMLYAGLWLALKLDTGRAESSPGLEAASRQGKRPGRRVRLPDYGPLIALGALGLGVVFAVQLVLGTSVLFWPLVLALVGVAVLWRQADEAQRARWTDSQGRVDLLRFVVGPGGAASYARLAAGIGLLGGALLLFAFQAGQADVARDVVAAGLLGVAGLALIVGPWLFRLAGDLADERAARIRTEERADMAAHLHDSVLQTLALIQKHADDGRAVATLARAQERDLRQWLYGEQTGADATAAGALRRAAAEVEDAHGVPVEVVTVGDAASDEATGPLVLAAREAMVNAAKHAHADKVDVYAEFGGGRAEVFVRDRGRGFDRDAVPLDRLGVRNSIEERMRRHGGTALIRTAPGEGTEVRLSVPLATAPSPDAAR